MSDNIVILGGGVAGLTAAHELVERGFDVELYEKRSIFGGKARSVDVPNSASEGRTPLPGEHGFRFFPAFYRHTFDTMRRIPYADNSEGVFGNLVATSESMIARKGGTEISIPIELPEIIDDWEEVLELLVGNPFGIPDEERAFFVDRLLTFLTACEERRTQEYENISWWEFTDAANKSEAYQQYFAIGVTRSLVAMQAEESSTRSVGRIYIQQLLGLAMPWLHVDSILDGPTNDVWIDPWVEYLDQHGVRFFPETTIEGISCIDGQIADISIVNSGSTSSISGELYVAALPVEILSELVTDELADAAPSLGDLDQLKTAWMNGIQFYLDTDVSIAESHVIYQGSPWALTSIAQHQFWDVDLAEYGRGAVEGIISICISDWTTPGNTVEKPAKECTPEEIKREVWSQLTGWLNEDETKELQDATVVDWFLDPSIEFPAPNETTNADPLLINTVGSLQYRPEATTEIPNLFLASDYVRTNTDLASMEAANEAARRAVNGILDAVDSDSTRCDVWALDEPTVFEPLKAYDRLRFNMGLPHQEL
jgi:uncharacterized protein with NAD-binding domain and iron-sulfur cluster